MRQYYYWCARGNSRSENAPSGYWYLSGTIIAVDDKTGQVEFIDVENS
jgi:elongation factor P hydroxylase